MTDSAPDTFTRAFGADSRKQLIEEYLASAGPISAENSWLHVYRLLLWIDPTTGLAHCYESDKAQPGRPWYDRTLLFHRWLSRHLEVEPRELGKTVDWLFRKCADRLAKIVARSEEARLTRAERQRQVFADDAMPLPGEDPALQLLLQNELATFLGSHLTDETWRRLCSRLRAHIGQENKRRNLVGEGFEDVLGALMVRAAQRTSMAVLARPLLHTLPGFRPPPSNEKPRRVDLAVVGPGKRRILVSAKWSIRADREEQFGVDFETYSRLEDAGQDFEFVLVTNEFDPARLIAACNRRRPGSALFSRVVHVNPEGPLGVYGPERHASSAQLRGFIEQRRFCSLETWLRELTLANL